MFRGTTILAIRHKGETAIAGDGQISLGNTIMKNNTRKIRKIYNNNVLTGFAGTSADAITLFEKFEAKLEEYNGKLLRAAVELAKDWRTDKVLRRLEAMMVVADKDHLLIISGNGDVMEPDNQVASVGSGSPYAQAAAVALLKYSDLSAEDIVKEALQIASTICIYTNDKITVEKL